MRALVSRHANPATAIAIVALVFAMTGGAFAVTSTGGGRGSGGAAVAAAKKGKSKAKVVRGPAGPRGPEGKQGPEGKAGATGPEGKAGANGTDGTNGTNGANGAGVTTESFTGEVHGCEEGGVLVKSASGETAVCNGAGGGSSSTLPPGKTETGTWTLSSTPGGIARIAISFSVPLAPAANPTGEPALGETQVHFVKTKEKASASCGEDAEGVPVPTAAPGNLCIYESTLIGAELPGLHIIDSGNSLAGAGVAGAMLWFPVAAGQEAQGWGNWAVTAPVS